MRISDWSSDVCSSDLLLEAAPCDLVRHEGERRVLGHVVQGEGLAVPFGGQALQLDRRGEAGKRRGGKRPADGDGCRNTVGPDLSPWKAAAPQDACTIGQASCRGSVWYYR